ncbi:MAG: hypothetical protein ACTSX8_02800 [Alphaproteobacteria bacterium]
MAAILSPIPLLPPDDYDPCTELSGVRILFYPMRPRRLPTPVEVATCDDKAHVARCIPALVRAIWPTVDRATTDTLRLIVCNILARAQYDFGRRISDAICAAFIVGKSEYDDIGAGKIWVFEVFASIAPIFYRLLRCQRCKHTHAVDREDIFTRWMVNYNKKRPNLGFDAPELVYLREYLVFIEVSLLSAMDFQLCLDSAVVMRELSPVGRSRAQAELCFALIEFTATQPALLLSFEPVVLATAAQLIAIALGTPTAATLNPLSVSTPSRRYVSETELAAARTMLAIWTPPTQTEETPP